MNRVFGLISCLVVSFTITGWAAFPTQKLERVKTDLNAEFGFPVDRDLCILTVTRTPVQMRPTSLISHCEFEQLLRLLYASTVYPGNWLVRWFIGDEVAPDYSNEGVHLNDYLDNETLLDGLSAKEKKSIDRTRHNLGAYFATNNLANKCKIVVFNEMFFSQELPLNVTQKNFINQKLFDISYRTRSTIFYPNFLYFEQRQEMEADIRAKFNRMESLKNSGYMLISDRDFAVCRKSIDRIPNNSSPCDWRFLINESFSIYNGEILTKYRKVGYFHESDTSIRSGQLYDYGPGYDEAVSAPSSLQSILLRDFTTDVCLDLNIGIRRRNPNHWTNPCVRQQSDSCLHIIQASSIDPFCDTYNVGNLPVNRGIIHADKYPHPSWVDPSKNRPQDIYLPYRDGNAVIDNIVGDKEEFHVRFAENDYRFSFLQI